MRKLSIKQFVASIVLSSALLATVLVGAVVYAQDAKTDGANSKTANSLRISPTRTDVTADPGDIKVVKVSVTNPTDKTISVKAMVNDFIAGNEEDGSPALILDEKKFAENHSLKRFMSNLESFELAPSATKTVDVAITIPKDAEPGGYFGAVRFAPTNPDDGGQVNMSPSVASLILMRVNGDVPENLELTDFKIRQSDQVKSFFTNSNNISALVRFKNPSQVQLAPVGNISVKKGKKVVQSVNFNTAQPGDMILPSSARKWSTNLDKISGFGKYTVTGTFTYGTNNKTVDVSRSFWVVPIYVMVLAAIIVAAIVILLLLLVKRIRSRD